MSESTPIRRRFVFTLGTLLLALSSALMALEHVPSLALGLVFSTFGFACVEVTSQLYLLDHVPRQALNATIRGRTVRELAKDCLALAEAGLKRRAFLDIKGRDETRYLEPLQEIVARGATPAEELLAKYHGAWGGSVDPVFTEYAY